MEKLSLERENLFSEASFKRLLAAAWRDNGIDKELFISVLVEQSDRVRELFGADTSDKFEKYMLAQWEDYQLQQDQKVRDIAGYVKRQIVCDKGTARPIKDFKPIRAITAAELNKIEIAPVQWITKDILTQGLAMVCAPPKNYKSYLCLDLCIQVCVGGCFMGRKCEKSAALYLDLESTKRRPQNRIRQILGDKQWPDNLYLITADEDVGRLGDGFEAQIEFQLQEHKDIKLVVVDVFQMIRQPAKKNQGLYDRDYDDLQTLKKIADKYGVCVLLVHHSRKMRDLGDVFNEISGSSGMTGGLDTVWHISKENRFDDEATLSITGRDLAPAQLKIQFDRAEFRWKCLGTTEQVESDRQKQEYETSPIICTIRKMVKQGGGQWSASASELKSASRYVSTEIYDTPERIAKKIKNFEILLWTIDKIHYEYSRDGRNGRRYIFTDTTVRTVTTDTNCHY